MKELYCKYCVQILTNGFDFFLRYDGGEIATSIQEIPISESTANTIMQMHSIQEIFEYMHFTLSKELNNSRTVNPSEYIGNTIELIMG